MTSSLVSVAVITYNQEAYIRQCVESILQQQTDFSLEIIVADDGSTDGTAAQIEALQRVYPEKIILLRQPQNVGLIRNYQSALQACQGRYIAQIAGDDYFSDPHKLQKQHNYLEANPEVALVYTDCDFYFEDTQIWQRAVFESGTVARPQNFKELIATEGFLAPLTWMYRREHSPLTYPVPAGCADESYAYMLDLLQHHPIGYLPEVTAVRRMLSNSLSNNTDALKMWRYRVGVHQITEAYLPKYPGPPEEAEQILAQSWCRLLHFSLHQPEAALFGEAEAFFNQNPMPPGSEIFLVKELKSAHKEIRRLQEKLERKRWWKPLLRKLRPRKKPRG